MKVTQEPDLLDATFIRKTSAGLLLGVVICVAVAAGILRGSLGRLAPPGFVAGRQLLVESELAAVELGLLPTQRAPSRDEQAERRRNRVSLPERREPNQALSLDQAIDAYLSGARAPRGSGGVDYGRLEAGTP